MKRSVLLFAVILLASCATVRPQKYFTMDEMPDLVKCLPAPPAPGTPEFRYDSLRYFWGREQRKDPVRAAIADRDAGWQIDTVIAVFSEPFGMKLSPDGTPEIWHLLYSGIKTMEQIRVRPKAYFHRQRPFEYFNDHVLTLWEEEELRGEGSYPSGHTIRGWAMALMLAEINPDAAEALFAKGWEYGESRVIVGAHWQSDVDASRAAASIAYAKIQTSKEFRKQVAKARAEFLRITK